ISEASGNIKLFLEKNVTKNVTDPDTEISLKEARRIKPTIEVGSTFKQEISVEEFGRNAINIVKNTLIQRIKTNEKIFKNQITKLKDKVLQSPLLKGKITHILNHLFLC
ncbi:MAG: NusA N-terminal domain-containing protein, partial [Sulfurovaceae bacterium]